MNDDACRLCGYGHLEKALDLVRAPRNVQKLFKPEEIDRDRPVSLSVLQCPRCGFVQIKPFLEDNYYDDYQMASTHSQQMQDLQRDQAHDFVNRFSLIGKNVVEIGCGDGSALAHLSTAGAKVSGIEPSGATRQIAMSRGFSIESGYITAGRKLLKSPFDAFVSRQVLEHVPDLHDFLDGVWANLKPGAYGLVEVPSLEKAIADSRYYDFFPDHVNYFSKKTLRLVLEMHGFEVLEIFPAMFDEYLVAIMRKASHPGLADIQQTVNSLSEEMRTFIEGMHNQGKKVAIWGAGGKGLSALAAAGIEIVDLLVDSDPHKHGLLTPVSHLLVQSTEKIVDPDIGAVIVTALAYRNEIEKTLRETLKFTGSLAFLGRKLEVVP